MDVTEAFSVTTGMDCLVEAGRVEAWPLIGASNTGLTGSPPDIGLLTLDVPLEVVTTGLCVAISFCWTPMSAVSSPSCCLTFSIPCSLPIAWYCLYSWTNCTNRAFGPVRELVWLPSCELESGLLLVAGCVPTGLLLVVAGCVPTGLRGCVTTGLGDLLVPPAGVGLWGNTGVAFLVSPCPAFVMMGLPGVW